MKKLLLSLICLLAIGLPALADSVTITMESQGWSDQQDLASETIETDNFTISFAKNDATNPTKYFSSDKTVRLYKASSGKSNGGSFEIIPKDGIVLSSAVYKNTEEGNDNTISINNGIARYCNTTTSTVKIYSLTVTYSSAAGPSYPKKCDYPTFNYSDGEEVAAGSTIKATCATTGSTVTLTTPTGIITGEDGNGFAEYTIPESLVGTIAVIKATATVQGESEVLSAESTIDIDVIKAPETISDELTAKTFNLSSNTYTIYKSALENTGITYYAKASLNNNRMQINTSASTGGKNSGIISTDNQSGWIIDKIEVNGEIASDKLIIKVAHNPGTLTGKVGDTGKECGIAPNSDAVSVSATSFTTVDSSTKLAVYEPTDDYEYFSITSSGAQYLASVNVTYRKKGNAPTQKETVTLTWGEASSEYTVGQEGVTVELSADPEEALESVVVTSSDPAVTVDYTTVPGLVELTFNGACDNVTLTAAISENNEKYTAESKSISFAVKAPVVELTPEEIIATPALNEENEVTVKKGDTVTFSSKNASKLSVSIDTADATLENNPFAYTVTEDTMIEIVPVDSEGNLYTDLKKEVFIYVDENLDPQPTKATSTVTFDFVKNNHLCTEDDYTNDLNSYFYIRSRELGLIEAYIALEQNQTGSFNYTDNQGWNFNINGEDETKFQFVFYPNSEFESYGYKLTGIKIEGDFDDKFVVFNDYITSSELTNSMWNGLEDIVMLEAVAFENFTISAIDVTFEHDIVKMPELFGQDGKLGLSHSDGHEIYYKVVAENSQMRTVNRDPAYDDNFQLYTEPFTLRDGETIYAYAQHPHGMVSEILAKTYADIATGVEGIASDDAEGDVRYFNLQGVKVENPAEGIYIRVANGKAEKIIK